MGLCESHICRRKVLLKYFNDTPKQCDNCDACLNPIETYDGTIQVQKALSCIYRTGNRFGIAYIIDVLMANNNERITGLKHDTISTYGIGKDTSKQQWQAIFRQIITNDLAQSSLEKMGGLEITQAGADFLKTKKTIQLSKLPDVKITKTATTKKLLPSLSVPDQILFDALRTVRTQLATSGNVPPYVIFHDSTLINFATHKPTTKPQMLEISGVGQTKFDRYGEAFLTAIIANI